MSANPVIDWLRSNWLPLVIGLGIGGVVGAVIKALVDPPQLSLVPPQYQETATEYVQKWERAGVPEKTINMALKWAWDWSTHLASRLVPNNPDLAAKLAEAMYPQALGFAEKWIEAMTGINLTGQKT